MDLPLLLNRRRRGSSFFGAYGAYLLDGRLPSLIADFRNNVFATRSLDVYDYALAGQPAALVASFRDNAYLTSGRETMLSHPRHGLITSGRSTTMIVRDEDGIYKHGAHNLYRNGAGGAQAITVVSGRDYTIRMKGTGSIGYSGAATGTLSGTGADDVVRVEVTAASTTLTVTPSGSTSEIAVYQSDLGGMQLTSDGTDYVENNTGAALYATPVEYDVNGACSMPIWEARTNLNTRVAADASNWPVVGGAVCTTLAENKFGWFPGLKIASGGSANDFARSPLLGSVTSGVLYTFSILWKDDGSSSTVVVRLDETGIGSSLCTVTAAGVFTSILSTKGTLALLSHAEVDTDTYLTELTWTPNFTGASSFAVGPYSAVAGEYIIAYAGQLEAGLGFSTWMDTRGSTFTRAADNLYTLAASFGYRQTEGTIVAEFESAGYATVSSYICELHDGSANNRVVLRTNTSSAVALRSVVGGANKANVDAGAAQTSQDADKVAAAFKAGDNAVAFKGGASAAGSIAASQPSGITRLQYGSQGSPVQLHLNGKLYSLAYYPFRAANSDLEAASA